MHIKNIVQTYMTLVSEFTEKHFFSNKSNSLNFFIPNSSVNNLQLIQPISLQHTHIFHMTHNNTKKKKLRDTN